MARFNLLAVALMVVAGASAARGQDSEEVKRLKKDIELLQSRLEVANLKIEKLEKENEQLKDGKVKAGGTKTGGEKGAEVAKVSLSDTLAEGAVVRGDWKHRTNKMESGEWSLTIKGRDGEKFTGVLVTSASGKTTLEREVKGKISGNAISFDTVGTTKTASVSGSLKKEALQLVYRSEANITDMAAKVAK